jgi:hypothetical protein
MKEEGVMEWEDGVYDGRGMWMETRRCALRATPIWRTPTFSFFSFRLIRFQKGVEDWRIEFLIITPFWKIVDI